MKAKQKINSFVLDFQDIDKTSTELVGGKGANLGELGRIVDIDVPDGFCITTEAFKKIIEGFPYISELLIRLSLLGIKDRDKIRELSGEIRRAIEDIIIPLNITERITEYLEKFGDNYAYAVRSSATAEDLPTASSAGQQDTFLNVTGIEPILKHISKCWASLFTDRAVIYRMQNGFDHRKVHLAVVIQKMIFPQVAGILFTADPVTGNRKTLSIDASYGLGDALVSGMVNADVYKVSDGKIIDKKVPIKKLAIHALKGGGTIKQDIEAEQQDRQALTDEQILRLEQIGRRIELHFGQPQDVEWCLADDRVYILQSRPITTLFPVPETSDQDNHVYLSVGHQQMMTDAMKPLGLSIRQLTSQRPMPMAGGRLFVDIAKELSSPAGRHVMIDVLGKSDPLIKDALLTITQRENFIRLMPDDKPQQNAANNKSAPTVDYQTLKDYDPSIVAELIKQSETAVEELKQKIRTKSGTDLVEFIFDDIQQLKNALADSQSFGVIMTGMNAAHWINDKMLEWLSEQNAADTLTQSVPNNITSEMGLALLDLSDVIRSYPGVIEYLQQVKENNFLDQLDTFEGGQKVGDAIYTYLKKYGMRCAGEIDITRPRWSEKPLVLIPVLLSNIKNQEPGAGKRKFEQGLQEALKKEEELLSRLKQLPDGEQKAAETKRMIGLVRNLAGYREYPKYHIVSRYLIYKQAMLKEAERLLQAAVIRDKEDIYYLSFEELREVIRTKQSDRHIITRREAFKQYEKLTPPRVMTSDGEIITGKYKREDLPQGVIVGLAVSSGITEGRARIILNMQDADLEEGDILVTTFTDPSWTPLFLSIKGLVTEVGGLMTHGSVIAREYGLPAVVGIENVTRLIKDKQRIRINGTRGYVEILG